MGRMCAILHFIAMVSMRSFCVRVHALSAYLDTYFLRKSKIERMR